MRGDPTLIHHFLEQAAGRRPDAPAVWHNGIWRAYAWINERSNRLANYLVKSGLRRRQRVGVLAENSFDFIIAYYAILKASGVVVAINTDLRPPDIRACIEHAGAAIVVSTSRFFSKLAAIAAAPTPLRRLLADQPLPASLELPACIEVELLGNIYESESPEPCVVRQIDLDLAAIVYTSGSEGLRKGVMLSHRNIVANTTSIVKYLQLTCDDRIMDVLPFHYVYGCTLLNTHVAVAGSLVIDNRFAYPDTVLATMAEHEVTGFAGVPSTYAMLLNHSAVRSYVFPSLRYVSQAGGHMAVGLQQEVARVFSPAKLIVMYGATELSPRLTWVPPERLHEKWGSIGIPIPNTEAFVAGEDGNRLPPGVAGEIVGRGSNVMLGYWKDPEGSARVVRKGLYFTGDLGVMDGEGYLYVKGRVREMLKIGGNRVSPQELEEALLRIPGIQEVAVIGISDPILGEVPKAFVVMTPDSMPDEITIRKSLLEALPAYKVPKVIAFVEALPKSSAGKILKSVLREKERQA